MLFSSAAATRIILSVTAFAGYAGSALAGLAVTPSAGAPGPIAGAGLPILAVVGGAYWLVRRARGRSRT